jgi:hypothetical protein
MNSFRSFSIELGPTPKDFKAFIIKRLENFSKISKTSGITLEKILRKKDNHNENDNIPSYIYKR